MNQTGESSVLVTIKPEEVVLASELNGNGSKWNAGNWNNLDGIIVEIVRMRSTAEVVVDVGFLVRSTVTMSSLEELGLREGKRVYVHFKVDSLGISTLE